eukprot:TRINITY_DN1437_c0_g1_i3.p1 TRINITY_DN1437_c0_g1~~TRINITY_DN1437_c0_g1_i3.p1  ORF type:complete len:623 (-),score=51.66 TRINITY_DN1437_c0_g1_i3:952-2820(-)
MDGVEEAVSNMRSLKRFRDRDPHCKLTYGVKKLCRAFLEKVSGGDEVAMMKDVLCKGTLFQELSPSLVKFINSSPDDVRRGVIAALRKDGWSQSTVKQAGITAGDDIFKTSVAGAGEQGRPTIQTPQLRRSIKEAHEEHATTTSRTLKRETKRRRRTVSVKAMHRTFAEVYAASGSQVSYTTWRRLRPKEFQHLTKPNDMCTYCVEAKKVKVSLTRKMNARKIPWSITWRTPRMRSELEKNKLSIAFKKEAQEIIDKLGIWESHLQRVESQRKVYQGHCSDPPTDAIVLDIDFKAKGSLPMRREATSHDFYNSSSFTLCGIGAYWRDGSGLRKTVNFDTVLETLNSDARTAIAVLEHLFGPESGCVIPSRKRWIFWCDCGPHFRAKELVHWMMYSARDFMGSAYEHQTIELHFLGEKHGKSRRDGHFGGVSRLWERMSKRRDILTLADVAEVTQMMHNTYCEVLEDENFGKYIAPVVEFPSFTGAFGFQSAWDEEEDRLVVSATTSACEPWYPLVHSVKEVSKMRKRKLPPEPETDSDSDDVAGCLSGLEKKEKLISNVNRRLLQPPKRGRKPKATLESSSDGASSEEEPQSAPPEPPASAQPGRPVTPRTRGRRVVSGRKK